MGIGEMVVAGVFGLAGLAFSAVPIVFVFILWGRNADLQRRMEAVEKRLADRL